MLLYGLFRPYFRTYIPSYFVLDVVFETRSGVCRPEASMSGEDCFTPACLDP